VILYEVVTGRVPYEADTPFALIMKLLNEPLPPPRTLKPELPEAVEQVIVKALDKKPDQRYQAAGDLARALREAVGLTMEETLAAPPLTTIAPPAQVEAVPELASPEESPTTPPPSPYRGLSAFREEDAAYFFGREAFTEQLLTAVPEQALVAVIGPSGSGKSSVVFAGLVAQLRQGWSSSTGGQGSATSFTGAGEQGRKPEHTS
jgi:serine/threonine protein kinase